MSNYGWSYFWESAKQVLTGGGGISRDQLSSTSTRTRKFGARTQRNSSKYSKRMGFTTPMLHADDFDTTYLITCRFCLTHHRPSRWMQQDADGGKTKPYSGPVPGIFSNLMTFNGQSSVCLPSRSAKECPVTPANC